MEVPALAGPSSSEPLYKLQRRLRKMERGFRNRVRSILRDAAFVEWVWKHLFPQLPLLVNERCGAWYCPRPSGSARFKSTDGHPGTWSFPLTRLNLPVLSTAAAHGGCILVDASQSWKRFPDSFNRTVPMWAAMVNAVVMGLELGEALTLPPWVSASERSSILDVLAKARRELPEQTARCMLEACCGGRSDGGATLKKPLRCVWVDQSALKYGVSVEEILASVFGGRGHISRGDAWSFEGDDEEETTGMTGGQASSSTRCRFDASLHSTEDHFRRVATALLAVRSSSSSVLRASSSGGGGGGEERSGWAPSLPMILEGCTCAPPDAISSSSTDSDLLTSLPFTPLILLSASTPSASNSDAHSAYEGWNYLPGAGDDADSWVKGLAPSVFWSSLVPELLACENEDQCLALATEAIKKGKGTAMGAAAESSWLAQISPASLGAVPDGSTISSSIDLVADFFSASGMAFAHKNKKAIFRGGLAAAPAAVESDVAAVDVQVNGVLWPHEEILPAVPTSSAASLLSVTVSHCNKKLPLGSYPLLASLGEWLQAYSLVVLVRGAASTEEMRKEAEDWKAVGSRPASEDADGGEGSDNSPASGLPSAFVVTVPVGKPQYSGPCKGVGRRFILPAINRLVAAAAVRSRRSASASPSTLRVLFVSTPSAAAFSCILASSVALAAAISLRQAEASSSPFRLLSPPFVDGTKDEGKGKTEGSGAGASSSVSATTITKPQLKGSLSSCQVVFCNGSVPKEVQQDLWRYMVEEPEKQQQEGEREGPGDDLQREGEGRKARGGAGSRSRSRSRSKGTGHDADDDDE